MQAVASYYHISWGIAFHCVSMLPQLLTVPFYNLFVLPEGSVCMPRQITSLVLPDSKLLAV